jgi:hypothetical protein
MRRMVEAARLAPCKRAHDLVIAVDFAPFVDGLSSAVAQCRRCGAWFNHVFDALAPLPPLPPLPPLTLRRAPRAR